MATRKKSTNRKKTQYVRGKRKGAEAPTVARRGITIGLLLLIIGAVLFGLKQGFDWVGRQLKAENPRFEIQHLIISCDGKLTEDYIREGSGLREGMNLWGFSFEEVEARLEAISLVESVYLERKLPNTLIVKVKERVPVARIMGKQVMKYPFLVDRFQVVLPPRRKLASLPLIKGLDLDLDLGSPMNHTDVETALKIISICNSTLKLSRYIDIESLDLEYKDYIDMRLKDGIQVLMPRFSLRHKLGKLAAVIEIAKGQGQRVKKVDLTLDSVKVPVEYY